MRPLIALLIACLFCLGGLGSPGVGVAAGGVQTQRSGSPADHTLAALAAIDGVAVLPPDSTLPTPGRLLAGLPTLATPTWSVLLAVGYAAAFTVAVCLSISLRMRRMGRSMRRL